jgi:hypothetical protein
MDFGMAGVVASAGKFMEALPDNCPPSDAVMEAHKAVWRFVTNNPPSSSDFQSNAATKPAPPPTVSPCRWFSTSLFVEKKTALKKLPKARERFKYLIKVDITEKCGLTLKRKAHVDLWRFDTFKVPTVIEAEKL